MRSTASGKCTWNGGRMLTERTDAPDAQLSLPTRELNAWFAKHRRVSFVVLFGSLVPEREGDLATPESDVDIAIHTDGSLPLLERGAWIAELEELCGRSVDLVWLNPLPGQNPTLAHEIMTRGHLLFCREGAPYVAFKTRAILRYLDTAHLREQVTAAFRRRHGERS